jgi:hypothetical protein
MAHKKHVEFYFKRKTIYDDAKLSYEKLQKKNLEEISEIKDKQTKTLKNIESKTQEKKKIEQRIENILNKDQIYEADYLELISSTAYRYLDKIYDLIYNHNGIIAGAYSKNIDTDALAYAHANNLVEYKTSSSNSVVLTEKGRFFLKKYLQGKHK